MPPRFAQSCHQRIVEDKQVGDGECANDTTFHRTGSSFFSSHIFLRLLGDTGIGDGGGISADNKGTCKNASYKSHT